MKRSKEAIITRMLEICIDGASKTRIVYQANLNFHTVIPYLDLLIKKEMLVQVNNSSSTYHTTPKGAELLKELKSIQCVIPEIYNSAEKNTA
jgi:predicted transcriptional regulator